MKDLAIAIVMIFVMFVVLTRGPTRSTRPPAAACRRIRRGAVALWDEGGDVSNLWTRWTARIPPWLRCPVGALISIILRPIDPSAKDPRI